MPHGRERTNSSATTGAASSIITTPAAAADHDHAAVLVLTNSTLFELITGFMTGYPRVVLDFVKSLNPPQVMNRTFQNVNYSWGKRQRVLPDLAAAANNPAMFKLLYNLAQQPGYRRDPHLRLTEVMRYAVVYNQVGMLSCIKEVVDNSDDNTWPWRISNLMRMALHRIDPDLEVIEWVYTHIPHSLDPITGNDLRFHVERGNLGVVKWLYEHGRKITQRLVNAAAICGHAHVLRYLNEKSGKRCAFSAIHKIVESGDMDVLNVIFENQKVDLRRIALDSAAEFGRMEIATLLVESIPGVVTHWTLEIAAKHGQLDALKYLLDNFVGECSVQLMTAAAEHGHLEIVKYLHENRSEGCSPDALERAAKNGHLDVVEFLHDKYGLQCSREAMSKPASRRHWEILAFLERNGMLGN